MTSLCASSRRDSSAVPAGAAVRRERSDNAAGRAGSGERCGSAIVARVPRGGRVRGTAVAEATVMLHTLTELADCKILGSDGVVGHIRGLYVDTDTGTIRYVEVDTGSWLLAHRVLISPSAFGPSYWDDRTLTVEMSRNTIRHGPHATHPCTHEDELRFNEYYGWPPYGDREVAGAIGQLRHSGELVGARTKALARVHDLVIDVDSWELHELVVDHGRRVALSELERDVAAAA
jgi:sporulation protein YlmC with PRC-barrel domain